MAAHLFLQKHSLGDALNRPGFVGDFDVPWVSRSRILRIPSVTVYFPRIVSRTRQGYASPTLSGADLPPVLGPVDLTPKEWVQEA